MQVLTNQEFTYRESPAEQNGYGKFKALYGNTLKWNQQVSRTTFPTLHNENGLTITWKDSSTINISGTASSVSWIYIAPPSSMVADNHVYLITTNNKPSGVRFGVLHKGGAMLYNTDDSFYYVYKNIYGIRAIIYRFIADTAFDFDAKTNMIDLTLMFGETEANRINALGQQGAYNYFRSLFPLSYYQYDSCSLLSFNGNGIKTVGENQLNLGDSKSATANGVTASYDASTQKVTLSGTNTKTDSAYIIINFTPSAIPKFKIGETYVLSASSQLPASTYFNLVYRDTNNRLQAFPLTQIETRRAWRFTVPSNYSTFNDFQIGVLKEARQLSGEFGVQLEFGSTATAYEPYTESVLNLPISTYFPTGMKSAGNVYDELTPTKATTRIGAVDLGSLTWSYNEQYQCFITYPVLTDSADLTATSVPNFKSIYKAVSWSAGATDNAQNMIVCFLSSANQLRVRNKNFTDPTAFKSAMSGVYLYYELATPTETSFTTASLVTENHQGLVYPPQSKEEYPFFKSYKGGTEQLLPENGSVPATAPILADMNYSSSAIEVTTHPNPEQGGETSGDGWYLVGEEATVNALPNEHYAFNNWVLDGEIVSTDPEYTFEVKDE